MKSSSKDYEYTKSGSETASSRVVWLLNSLWGGNRSAMAEAIGCTHSVLTKIAQGQQSPGRRLLEKIASHPRVNPAWLASGEGEPIVSERAVDSTDGWPIPIVHSLFRGGPEQNRQHLTGESFSAAGAHYRPSRYWLQVKAGWPITTSRHAKIAADDLILMESDPAAWPQFEVLDDRLCIVDLLDDRQLRLGKVDYHAGGDEEEPPCFRVDVFDNPVGRPAKGANPKSQAQALPLFKPLRPDQVVAMGVLVVRRM